MSDAIFERIAVALEKIAASSANVGSGGAAPIERQVVTGAGGGPSPATVVTADDLLRVVQPLVQSEDTKAKVKAVLDSHGLNRLGEANESQYPSLMAAFQSIAGTGPAAPASQDLI